MSVPVFGLLCLFVMSFLLIAMVVGSVVVISSFADKRVWKGILQAGKVLLPVATAAVVLLLFFGVSATTTHRVHGPVMGYTEHQVATPVDPSAIPMQQIVPSHGDLAVPSTTVVAAETTANDLRPADALIPVDRPTPISAAHDLTAVTGPAWVPAKVEKTVSQNGDARIIVLPSALFATELEADIALEPQIQSLVADDFLSVVRSRALRPREMGWVSNLANSVVTDRYVETETRDLGAVTAPMYRVWKRLELSPQTRAQFFTIYRGQMQESRLMVASALVLALLAIPLAVLMGAKGARLTHGRGKPFWKISAVATVLLIWAAGFAWVNHCVVLF